MKNILLIGNPNCGKSTFFNSLAGANEHVGNWHGVTVACKEKQVSFAGERYNVIDSPGIYSLCPFSFEEEQTTQFLEKNKDCKIINICDRDNLQKNLYLTLCLLEEGFDVSILLNCTKKHSNQTIFVDKLSKALGVEVMEVDASKRKEIEKIGNDFFKRKTSKLPSYFDRKFLSFDQVKKAQTRFDFVDKVLSECTKKCEQKQSKIDCFVLNKFLSIPIFFALMLGIFYLTFFVFGQNISKFLNWIFELFSHPCLDFLEKHIGKTWIYDLFDKAIFGGISTILSFLPQVVMLFFFLSVFEESGYMARVAFVFDDLLSKIGLSGKSVYSILMSFGCSTSAISTCKIADSESAKIKTALACPYISCSAKIPIYLVFVTAFFGGNIFVIFSMYVLSLVVACLVCAILDKKILKNEASVFFLEFPQYRMVSLKKTAKFLYENSKDFLSKIVSVLLCCNIVLFVLSSFSFSLEYVGLESGKSVLNSLSSIICPLFAPLGFGNSTFVCVLLSGFVAKEVVVSSIALFNGVNSGMLSEIALSLSNPKSAIFFSSTASALSFLVFCVLYIPCLSSILMLKKEVGGKWCALAVLIQLAVSYLVSFAIYNVTFAIEIFGFFKVFFLLFAISLVLTSMFFLFFKKKNKCTHCTRCSGNNFKDCDKNKL